MLLASTMMDYMNKHLTHEHQVLQAEFTKMSQLGLTNVPTETKISIKIMINCLIDSIIEGADRVFLILATPAAFSLLFPNTSMICLLTRLP